MGVMSSSFCFFLAGDWLPSSCTPAVFVDLVPPTPSSSSLKNRMDFRSTPSGKSTLAGT